MRLPSGDHAPNGLFHVATGGPLPSDCTVMEPNCHMLKGPLLVGLPTGAACAMIAESGATGFGSGCATKRSPLDPQLYCNE